MVGGVPAAAPRELDATDGGGPWNVGLVEFTDSGPSFSLATDVEVVARLLVLQSGNVGLAVRLRSFSGVGVIAGRVGAVAGSAFCTLGWVWCRRLKVRFSSVITETEVQPCRTVRSQLSFNDNYAGCSCPTGWCRCRGGVAGKRKEIHSL
jgi:hypothetical protein